MRILIDGDGCPVVDTTIKIANEYGIECIILCDTSHVFEKKGAKTITISKGQDNVDFALVSILKKGDIVVTQDYGLAAMCLAMGGYPINQNGMWYTNNNIDSLLEGRHLAQQIRRAKGKIKGPSKRKSEQDDDFLDSLRKLCDMLIKKGSNNL